MPRNPNKRHCQIPGCNNWAMRGRAKCRSHADPELGPRGAGAPFGNLNALKTGEHIDPLGRVHLRRLVKQLVQDPESFEELVAGLVHDLYTRVGYGPAAPRSIRTLLALAEATRQLIPHLAQALFIAELDYLAGHCPPDARAGFRDDVWRVCAPLPPERRLIEILAFKKRLIEKSRAKKADTASSR